MCIRDSALATSALGIFGAFAAKKTPPAPLTEAGKKLEAQYSEQLATLKKELAAAVPAVNAKKKAEFLAARESEVASAAKLEAAQKRMGEISTAKALVGHAKGKWIGGADKGIAAAKAKLTKAKTDADREAAQKDLAHWQQNRKDGEQALAERQANLDKAQRDLPQVQKDLKEAERALAEAKDATLKAINDIGLRSFLSSDQLDAKLAKHAVMLLSLIHI